jgi:hypothetical protein
MRKVEYLNSIETACQNIYTETKMFYTQLQGELKGNDFGFKILNGPPRYEAPVFLISYQPGGSEDAKEKCKPSECTWPERLEHVYEPKWKLSKELRTLFEPLPMQLESCVALNALFFRAPKISAWNKALSTETRERVSEFCLPRVLKILQAVQPKFVLVNGLETLRLLDAKWQEWQKELISTRGVTLVRKGTLANFPSMTVNHISSYPYTRDKRQDAYSLIRKEILHHN